MGRLTARTENGNAYLVNVKPDEQEVDSPHKNTLQCLLDCFERLAAYEDTGLTPEDCTAYAKAESGKRIVVFENYDELNKVGELLQAEREGRCVALPCKIGNPVFRISNGMVFDDWEVAYADVYKDEVVLIDDSDNAILEGQIGKEVFLTRAEAEAALKKKENNDA